MAPSFATLTDTELLATVRQLAGRERQATAALIASLAEVDARRLYLGEGCSSLFAYCTRVLHLSEHAAYGRIQATRVARRFPDLLERLADGSITLTTVVLLAPHLTAENHGALLDAARHKSRREVEELVAGVRPRPDAPSTVRKLPTRAAEGSTTSPPPPSAVARTSSAGAQHVPARVLSPTPAPRSSCVRPLSPARYKVQFTLDADGLTLLERAQALMRHRMPDGDLAVLMTEALTLLVAQLEKTKAAATERPRADARRCTSRSRAIPAAVRRAVWARDKGRCAFVGTQGRCTETGFLEFHHVRPFAAGGQAVVGNIELRCRAHNQYEARQYFGELFPWTARETAHACRVRLGPDRVAAGHDGRERLGIGGSGERKCESQPHSRYGCGARRAEHHARQLSGWRRG